MTEVTQESRKPSDAVPYLATALRGFTVNPDLVLTFGPGTVRGHLPSRNRTLDLSGTAAELLVLIGSQDEEELAIRLRKYSPESVLHALAMLQEAGALVSVPDAERSRTPSSWSEWGDLAWRFHVGSRSNQFISDPEQQIAESKRIGATPPPDVFKCTCSRGELNFPLPRPTALRTEIGKAFLARRTCRNFSPDALSQSRVSDLLFYTAGWVSRQEVEYFGAVLKKCAPSPGARHGTELYAVAANCEGIARGIYHYCIQHHALNIINSADGPELKDIMSRAMAKQPYFADAPLCVLMTSVLERYAWKYKHARIYRLIHLEVGHYAQNFVLAATAMGLGPFQTAALDEALIERTLRLNGEQEAVMYCVGAGLWGSPERDERRLKTELADTLSEDLRAQLRIIQ